MKLWTMNDGGKNSSFIVSEYDTKTLLATKKGLQTTTGKQYINTFEKNYNKKVHSINLHQISLCK